MKKIDAKANEAQGFRKKIVYAALSLFILSMVNICLADVINPSAAYCTALGFVYTNEKTAGGDIGICSFPDGSSCSAWNFTEGKCGQKYSYCALHGYAIKAESNDWRDYSVCVLSNGSEVEVTKLMGLVLRTDRCGDGICSFGENYGNCPGDCPSGVGDGYCDRVSDGKCDPDCRTSEDPDCLPAVNSGNIRASGDDQLFLYGILIVLMLALVFLVLHFRFRTNGSKNEKP